MTIGALGVWILAAIALIIIGAKGGVLLLLSRAIDNMRAAIRCAEFAWSAARWEWGRSWDECKRWAERSR